MPGPGKTPVGVARFAGRAARGVVECIDVRREPERLREGGPWFVVADFDGPQDGGRARAWRFAERVDPDDVRPDPDAPGWSGPDPRSWTSSLDRPAYEAAVARVRDEVRKGEVYQANVCRVLAAPLAPSASASGSSPPSGASGATPPRTRASCTSRRAAASSRRGS